jgi:hypothetical protein
VLRHGRIHRDAESSCRYLLSTRLQISRYLAFLGASVGGAIGWWAGMYIGMMTAFMLSIIGTGAGIYAGRRLADRLVS